MSRFFWICVLLIVVVLSLSSQEAQPKQQTPQTETPPPKSTKPESAKPQEETKPETTRLRQYLQARLPEYMIPRALIAIRALPLTPNGKIDRKRLPAVKDMARQAEGADAGARTPTEEIVAGIFKEVLRLDRVGRSDNFFESGGHSLLATQVVSRVRKAPIFLRMITLM